RDLAIVASRDRNLRLTGETTMPALTQQPHDGRVALVTGAASGIGQAVAVGLAERGATVIVAGHGDLTATTDLIAPTGTLAIAAPLDVSDPSSIDALREQ